MRLTSTGLGIGTSSVTNAKLKVSGAAAGGAIMSEDTSSTTSFVRILGDATSQNLLNWQDGTSLRFATSTQAYGTFNEGMRINSSGNLLVGTTTGNFNARITSYNASSYTFESIRTGTGSEGHVVFVNSNGAVGSIFTNASLTIYNTTSDYRLKTVVGSVTGQGARIDALEPIEFEWNEGGRTKGFLAHKFAEVYPNSVVGEKDAVDEEGKPIYQAMQSSSSEVMADLIAEIQSLRKRVALLESK